MVILLLTAVYSYGSGGENDTARKTNVIRDDLGKEFEFEKPPGKVVTLAPNLTEMIYKLNAEEKLIGNTTYCNYPPEAEDVEKVGDLISVDFEKVSELKPDLIFMTVEGNTKNNYQKLVNLGYKVFVSNPRTFEGIHKTFMDLGEIFDKHKLAGKLTAEWDFVVSGIWNKSKQYSTKSAMFLVQVQPVMLAGENTFIHEYLRTCNLENIAGEAEQNYPKYSREEILLKDPDCIITTEDNRQKDFVEIYPEWAGLQAVRENNIIYVDSDIFFRPGPRFVNALERLFNRLHSKDQ